MCKPIPGVMTHVLNYHCAICSSLKIVILGTLLPSINEGSSECLHMDTSADMKFCRNGGKFSLGHLILHIIR
jgi:hypothetical protein